MLSELGVDAVIFDPFTPEFARIEAGEFLPWLRRRLPGLAAVHVGGNWRFGAGRSGDVACLVESARGTGLSVLSVPHVNSTESRSTARGSARCSSQGRSPRPTPCSATPISPADR